MYVIKMVHLKGPSSREKLAFLNYFNRFSISSGVGGSMEQLKKKLYPKKGQ